MGNKLVATACAVLKNNPKMTDHAEFWEKIGLPGVEQYYKGEMPPVWREISNIADRVLSARANPEGDKIAAGMIADERKPLRRFVVQRKDWRGLPVLPARLYELRPTKGWKPTSLVSAAEVKAEVEDRKTPCFSRSPTRAVKIPERV